VFLGWRNALFAALGIPVTFMITFIFLHVTDRSLNGNSLFGLVLVLGMVVDDAIIVIENCYRYIQKGISPYRAAVIGTKEVAMPVFAFTATTISAFLPLMLVPGLMGKFMKIIPIAVSLALVASLLEAFIILPTHIAEWSKRIVKGAHSPGLSLNIRQLRRTLRWRYVAVSSIIVIFLVSIMLIPLIGVDLFADEEISQFYVWVTCPEGTKLEATDSIIRQIEQKALQLPSHEVAGIVGNAGIMQTESDWSLKSNVGQVIVDLVELEERDRSLDEIIDDLRQRTANISGIQSIEFGKISSGPPTGDPIEVKVKGDYLDVLEEVAELVKDELRTIPGVFDVKDDFFLGKKELKIFVDTDKAHMLGLTNWQVAYAVRNAFEGGKAGVYRESDEEIDIIVKYNDESRQSMEDVENLRILTPSGHMVAFKDIAQIKVEQGYANIKRFEKKRAITVSADIDESVTSSVEVNQELIRRFQEIGRRYPGYSLDFRGEFQEFNEAFEGIYKLFTVGVIIMYIILGGQFRSFVQPLIIMLAIPFGFIGCMVGLLIIGKPFNIATMYGIVALAGIVVNDSLVLVSFINNARAAGVSRWRSIMQAGKVRLRPIILTSITTIFGLLPMAIGLGGTSVVWAPLAMTISFGLLFSTVMTLFIVPALYAIIDDVKKLLLGKKAFKVKSLPSSAYTSVTDWSEIKENEFVTTQVRNIGTKTKRSE